MTTRADCATAQGKSLDSPSGARVEQKTRFQGGAAVRFGLKPLNEKQAECRHWQLRDTAVRCREIASETPNPSKRIYFTATAYEFEEKARATICECGVCVPQEEPTDGDRPPPSYVRQNPVVTPGLRPALDRNTL